MKTILRRVIAWTKPWVWRLAEAYDLRVDRHCFASGQNPLIIEDDAEARRHHISKSVRFNTRSGVIRVGANTLLGENVQVLTGTHLNIKDAAGLGVSIYHVPEQGRDITIGRGCFVGAGAIIIGPVTIGDYAVVGAGTVVTHDVPPRTFVAGVPAKIVRTL